MVDELDQIERIDIREFRETGYLAELNRRFLHPLGLALEVVVDERTGEESLGGVWDYRGDPEGIAFVEIDAEHLDKAATVRRLWHDRAPARRAALGYMVQPVGPGEEDVEELRRVLMRAYSTLSYYHYRVHPDDEELAEVKEQVRKALGERT